MKSADEIKQNWSEYRCNPPYWIYSSNIASDMQYCVQNTMNSTKTATQNEFMSSITMLTDMAATFNEANLSNQESSSLLGDSLGNITGNIMGVFNNVTMSMTKIISGIINMTGEVIGIMITLLYIMDGSMKTMASLWAGPPGQAVRFIGSCFHKNTVLLVLEQNKKNIKNKYKPVTIDNICVGDVLSNGDVVLKVLALSNIHREPYYTLSCNINGEKQDIYVTGEHFMYDKKKLTWTKVKNLEEAIKTDIIDDVVYSLVTHGHTIPIGECMFWDWEDDELDLYPI